MKNWLFILSLLCTFSQQAFAGWILLDRQQYSTVEELRFVDHMDTTYEDYIFVVDILEPFGGHADVVMQLSADNGNTWVSDYTGGISTIQVGDGSVHTNNMAAVQTYVEQARMVQGKDPYFPPLTPGIVITDIANDGAFFVGTIQISNTNGMNNYGNLQITGSGSLGPDSTVTNISGASTNRQITAVRFVSADPNNPILNRASVTMYGLQQF